MCPADHLAETVDRRGSALSAAEGSEVGDRSVTPHHCVAVTADRIRASDDLVVVIDATSAAIAIAREVGQGRPRTTADYESALRGGADDLPEIVDAISGSRAEIAERAVMD